MLGEPLVEIADGVSATGIRRSQSDERGREIMTMKRERTVRHGCGKHVSAKHARKTVGECACGRLERLKRNPRAPIDRETDLAWQFRPDDRHGVAGSSESLRGIPHTRINMEIRNDKHDDMAPVCAVTDTYATSRREAERDEVSRCKDGSGHSTRNPRQADGGSTEMTPRWRMRRKVSR